MIDPSLLDRLRKADPVAYSLYDALISKECTVIGRQILGGAILQHVLQDAIAAKGWFYWVQWDTNYGNVAGINKEHPDKEYMCDDADSPTEALLKCYLAAVEG